MLDMLQNFVTVGLMEKKSLSSTCLHNFIFIITFRFFSLVLVNALPVKTGNSCFVRKLHDKIIFNAYRMEAHYA